MHATPAGPRAAWPRVVTVGRHRIGRVLEKVAGVFLIGFGIKLAISK